MKIEVHNKKEFKNLSFIGALPGIGNVGKLAIDYMIEKLNAKKIQTLTFPDTLNSVIVTKSNTLALPTVEIYHKKIKGKNIILLTGELNTEDKVEIKNVLQHTMSFLSKNNCQKIITIAGIGMEHVPENPEIYVTGNTKTFYKNFKLPKTVKKNASELVRNINGFSGILPTLAKSEKIHSCCLLTETYNSPFFLGYKSAKEIIKVLSKQFDFKICFKKLDQEIEAFDLLLEIGEDSSKDIDSDKELNYFN
ncbi:hypothetical protein HOK68_03335 [Candidatus Woesearchaeota archaeon]|jgi:uncharacterized protein|nr:hypothetical protein [Candidatus Woesearchaeota archaeon]MBT4387728.1 hypothetical protein [Candidatus Woesearchaeota archaeon]MBT4595547.1 hypothetical protein [Candidatus Woesearchaeota archaeon]MBT5740970.1 hypothetical protein [Candidatus Woesearchaeota archaeon]MBT6505787.1 hypothetical protein [Candidatus Woesearchaeota archaeon]